MDYDRLGMHPFLECLEFAYRMEEGRIFGLVICGISDLSSDFFHHSPLVVSDQDTDGGGAWISTRRTVNEDVKNGEPLLEHREIGRRFRRLLSHRRF